MSNYHKKSDLKIGVHQILQKKVYLANIKSDIDRLYIGKLHTAPVDIRKLSDLIKNEVVRKN